MRMYDIIEKKRDGRELTEDEIRFFVNGCTEGIIPDYQISALLMAIYFRGMSHEETLNLTIAMAESGDRLDLSAIDGIKVDKHSTGGIGDKTTLVIAPMVAALGCKVAKMSGRGLGYTGGTIDKLESIEGFSTSLTEEAFARQVNDIGIALTGQTGNLAPADKKLYALRDVTATVESIPLIAGSIMSKKIASGADAIVLDVKAGSGAFMKNVGDAERLAREMVSIGRGAGLRMYALITDMDQPLGYAIGNALEVIEAIETLKGNGPEDLTELCYELATYMVLASRDNGNAADVRRELECAVKDGSALKKMSEFLMAQGADGQVAYDTTLIRTAKNVTPVHAVKTGYVSRIESEDIGKASIVLGAGRTTKEDVIDTGVGIVLARKVGDRVESGEILASVYCDDAKKSAESVEIITKAYAIADRRIDKNVLIKRIVD